jgi:hypothetical protein
MRSVIRLSLGLLLFGACMPRHGPTVGATERTVPAPDSAGWVALFDGITTNGWRRYQADSAAGWRVVDGALTAVPGAGDIITTRQFPNAWELELEWMTGPGGNSGIFFDVVEAPGLTRLHESGPEFQILDDESFLAGMTPAGATGANYALHAPVRDVRRPLGEWNHVRLVVNGNHVEHWMNGVKLLEYELGSDDWRKRVAGSKFRDLPHYAAARHGHIGLQEHGAIVAFRTIRIRETATTPRTKLEK